MRTREIITHKLKTLTEYFKEVEKGNKTFEVRFNDRNFIKGDILHLMEYSNKGEYTGKSLKFKISYILENYPALTNGWVILALNKL